MNKKNPDYLILVNEDNKLPDGFENTVELISVENSIGDKYEVEEKTYEAFSRLREELLMKDGIQTEIVSSYRSLKEQEDTFEEYIEKYGEEYANKYVAKPGCSEHHTGIAIDVGIMLDGKLYSNSKELLALEHLYKTVHEKLAEYGFILRYPKGKESITKINYEPWHFRYIGSPESAKEIADKGMCFEEYHECI